MTQKGTGKTVFICKLIFKQHSLVSKIVKFPLDKRNFWGSDFDLTSYNHQNM